MAYIDSQLLFSDAQAVSADAYSTNVIDLGVARDLGTGEPLVAVITIDTAADITTGDETYSVQLRASDAAAMSSPTTLSTTTFTAAQLALGKQVTIPVASGVNVQRYLALYYDTGGTTPTVSVTAFLSPRSMVPDVRNYPRGYTIS